jgi:hypothetical protein
MGIYFSGVASNMMIQAHWTTEIRRAITKHFHAAAETIHVKMFLGEDQKRVNENDQWVELKVFGPFFTQDADGQAMLVNVQIRIACSINTQKGENIYDITNLMGVFAAAASGNILVSGITEPGFCLNDYNIRTIERGFVQTKVPLKVGYVEADLKGIIEQERIIEV